MIQQTFLLLYYASTLMAAIALIMYMHYEKTKKLTGVEIIMLAVNFYIFIITIALFVASLKGDPEVELHYNKTFKLTTVTIIVEAIVLSLLYYDYQSHEKEEE